jgi:cell division protein FtsZ
MSRNEEGLKTPNILVMGVGGAGVRAVARMCELNPGLDALAVDTDAESLKSIPEHRVLHIGNRVTHKFSAGGDDEVGRQAVERDSSRIRARLRQADLLVIVAGLGGGTGSGAVPVITRIAREADTLVLCLLTLPFDFEGEQIEQRAQNALKRIRPHADAIVRIPNRMLVRRSEAELSAEEAFERGLGVMQAGVLSLWRILSQRGICGLDFAALQTMLRFCDGYCHFAGAEAAGSQRARDVAQQICSHKLLNDGKILKTASGILIGLTGGHDLLLSEVDELMERVQEQIPDGIWFNFGVVVDPAFEHRLSAIVLVAERWKEPLIEDGVSASGAQAELPLEIGGRGVFEQTDPTIHENEDLDVPAYIRRGIRLPR